jgi:hypothetical protein
MAMLRALAGALLVVTLVTACEDGSGSDGETEDTLGDGGDTTTDDGGATEPETEVAADESQTCHNIQVQDGDGASNSTQLVPVEADAPEGTEVVLEYTADRQPEERTGRGALGGDGTGVVYVPLYSVGETLTLEGATVGGAEAGIAAGSEESFTVAPLTDPATTCDAAAQSN